jgi:hypothetical protein
MNDPCSLTFYSISCLARSLTLGAPAVGAPSGGFDFYFGDYWGIFLAISGKVSIFTLTHLAQFSKSLGATT